MSATDDLDDWDAWQRGLAAAKALLATPTSDVAKDREDKWRDWFDKRGYPPIVSPDFCTAEGCGLTVDGSGNGLCWAHRKELA